MNAPLLKLRVTPIVEAIIDFDCAMTVDTDLEALEPAAKLAFNGYPKVRRAFVQQMQIEAKEGAPVSVTNQSGIAALQFFSDDERQLVQIRSGGGYSFNRLAPYSSLDDYLPEVERTWAAFQKLIAPQSVRLVRLRYINRLLLPLSDHRLQLEEYLATAPRLPDEKGLLLTQFFDRNVCVEESTGNTVSIVTTGQPEEAGKLPVILDIDAVRERGIGPCDWPKLSESIASLRSLKNLVFRNSLTPKCLNLYE
jgi:uncharacterized protein (TIGR04255 family)